MLSEREALQIMAGHARVLADALEPDGARRFRAWASGIDATVGRPIDVIEREERQRRDEERRRQSRAWDETSTEERDQLVIDAIGDDRLTIRETMIRCQEARPDAAIYQESIRAVLKRLVRNGALEREPETFCNKPRYRYAKRRPMLGPIADLDGQFTET